PPAAAAAEGGDEAPGPSLESTERGEGGAAAAPAPIPTPSTSGACPAEVAREGANADANADAEASVEAEAQASAEARDDDGAPEEDAALEFTWICSACHEAECVDDPEAPLLLCDGTCNRPFHPPCANVVALPPDDEPWICGDCAKGRHACAVCKEYGDDGVDVFACDARGCGLFYHESCLSVYEVGIKVVEVEVPIAAADGASDGAEGEAAAATKTIGRPKFRCPAHQCWTCAGDIPPLPPDMATGIAEAPAVCVPVEKDRKKKVGKGGKRRKSRGSSGVGPSACWGAKSERLFRCLDCPISYHLTCLPPSARFHELAMLCHEHAFASKLPYLDAEYSMQAAVERDVEEKIEDMRRKEKRAAAGEAMCSSEDEDTSEEDEEGENSFFPGLVGSVALFEEEQLVDYTERIENGDGDDDGSNKRKRRKRHLGYCLPCDFKEEVYSKPPSYTHVNGNRYNPRNRPKRHPPTNVTCSCEPSTEEGVPSCGFRCLNRLSYVECVGDKRLKSGEKNPYWNCNCGPECGNRAMSRREFAKCRPAREEGRGWGLIAVDGVEKGDLVQEYAGEIVDESTKERRLREWSEDHPNDPNFYLMHLEPGWYIDAREVANLARFINHSCDPNCRLVPVNVSGHTRVAIVCVKDVPPGGFLCYDYQFDTNHGDRFVCRCGATNCRGTMKGGKADGGAGGASEDGGGPNKAEKKTKRQLLADAKARVRREEKFLRSMLEEEDTRLRLTGQFVPGGDPEMAETVAGGPRERHRREAREGRVFLWRNARAGGDFAPRCWRVWDREGGGSGRRRSERRDLAKLCEERGAFDAIAVVGGR
ncbi:hypothetical protein ACHAWF_010545, partial [Thalassiosira exigua]